MWQCSDRRWKNRPQRCLVLLGAMVSLAATMPAVAAESEPTAEPVGPDHAEQMAEGRDLFAEHVRPIFMNSCVSCHGERRIRGDLDLVTRDVLLEGGQSGDVVEPGSAADSLLYQVITHEREPYMPHKEPKLDAAAIEHIREWIDLGAPYDKPLLAAEDRAADGPMQVTDVDREFWSFQPLANPEPPEVAGDDWVRTPIDRFVLEQMEQAGVEPNEPADRRRLIRRAYFGVTGLPPTPAQVEAFINDESPDAWQDVVDDLLARPTYGERWAQHWLDIARFAESHGFEQDYDRPHAYHYRDFVIQALNRDMPYDQFVRWQIAGDEIAPEKPLANMATGFLGAGVFPTQLTEREFEPARYDEMDDMLSTTGVAMLGVTVGCARCHDHKYDPIPEADYYRMLSIFTTTIRSNVEMELNPEQYERQLANWQAEHEPLVAAREQYEQNELPEKFQAWLADDDREWVDASSAAWQVLDPVSHESEGGATLTKQADGALLASGDNPEYDTYTITTRTRAERVTAVRLEALAHESMVKGGPGRAGNGNFALTDFRVVARPLEGDGDPVELELTNPRATFEQNGLPVAATLEGGRSAWAVDPQFGKDHAAAFNIAEPATFPGGMELTFTLKFENNTGHNIGRPRLAISTRDATVALDADAAPQADVEIAALLDRDPASLSDGERERLLHAYRRTDDRWVELNEAVESHAAERPERQKTPVMIASENVDPIPHHADGRGFPHFYEETYVLSRGDTTQKEEVAEPGFLQVLTTHPEGSQAYLEEPPEDASTSYRRLGLARWLTDAEHGAGHLLARVIVNRLWQHHLGRGIVATPNDFGMQGQRPTHPELLDYLAQQLIANDWRLKPIHRMILTSAVYQTSDTPRSASMQTDPDNELFWRWNRRRLEAEPIRDAMLAAAGTLDDRMFGEGHKEESHDRRSIYSFLKRSDMPTFLTIFDRPAPLTSIAVRPTTTVAPQALLLMNNDEVRRLSVAFADRVRTEATADNPAPAVRRAYAIAFNREPDENELENALTFLHDQGADYAERGDENAALADLCQLLLASNEFMYVD